MKPRFFGWQLLALLLPAAYLAMRWPALPAVVPTHFNAQGQANGYSSKKLLIVLAVGLPAALYLLLYFLPRLDPKRYLDSANPNWHKLRLIVQLLLGGVGCFAVFAAGGDTLRGGLKPGMAGLLGVFALLGNYLSTVPPNYFVGVRTPWTLESPVVWAKTHRLAGRLFFVGGLVGAVLVGLLPSSAATWIVTGVMGGSSLAAVGYSWWAWRNG